MVNSILKEKNDDEKSEKVLKNINSQLIITTHSAHILDSKVHTGNTFNNINYVTIDESENSIIIPLNDEKILERYNKEEKAFKFVKKHMKNKMSELFFADAIIMVEGNTEEMILRYYIDNHCEYLKSKYITIFNVCCTISLKYQPILEILKVPVLIISDLDIKRDYDEKKKYSQITKENLGDRLTTNSSLSR